MEKETPKTSFTTFLQIRTEATYRLKKVVVASKALEANLMAWAGSGLCTTPENDPRI